MIHEYVYTNMNEYNLDWCIKRIRELSDEWASTKTEWSDTKTEWENYKNYIDNYFANLDVSDEINHKLELMAMDGTLTAVIRPIFDDIVATVPGVVTDWLGDHIIQETGYVLDDTLTTQYAAADAKAVGDRLTHDETIMLDMMAEKTENLIFLRTADVDHVNWLAVPMDLDADTYTLSADLSFIGTVPANTNISLLFVHDDNSYDQTYLPYVGGRNSVTITTTAHSKEIRFYSAVSSALSVNYHSVWEDIQLIKGDNAVPYKPMYVSNDIVARYDDSENLWPFGDQSFTATKQFNLNLDAGTYIISANVKSRDSNNVELTNYLSRFSVIYLPSLSEATYAPIGRNAQVACMFTLSSATQAIKLMASNTAGNSANCTSEWKNIHLYKANMIPTTGYDDPDMIFKAENATFSRSTSATSNLNWIWPIVKNHEDDRNVVISIDATVTDNNATPTLKRPCVRFYYSTGDQGTTYYTIAETDERTQKEFRLPPWPTYSGTYKNQLYVQFQITPGFDVTIHKMEIRYNDKKFMIPYDDNMIMSHGAYMFYPAHSLIATRMMAKTGCSCSIQIPKISSDGIVFFYHDDTFDETTTILRNPDGTTIQNSPYQGEIFDNIPFSYLEGLDWGYYKNACFAGTKPMKLDEYLFICKTSGMYPAFSIHPTPSSALLDALYDGLKKYNLLDKTIMKCGDSSIFALLKAKFTDEIHEYVFNIPQANMSTLFVNSVITLMNGLPSGVKKAIELFINVATSAFVSQITSAGIECSIAYNTHTTTEGITSFTEITEGDIRKYLGYGATKFTEARNPSQGMNW